MTSKACVRVVLDKSDVEWILQPHLMNQLNSPDAEGGCLCGAARFRVTGQPLALSHCHCESCRRAIGSAGVAWGIFTREEFTVMRGSLTRYRSSPQAVRTFCGICGTSISYDPDDAPAQVELATATFDEPERFPPSREVWLEYKLSWELVNQSLMSYDRGSSE